MKIKEIPMSIEEFELMEHPFGWKAEYWDGKAVLTPREQHVRTKLCLTPRSLEVTDNFMAANPMLKPQMIAAFYEAFQDSVEFCNWPELEIQKHAERNINNYFAGVRGEPLPVSVMVLEPNSYKNAGLALFTNKAGKINLDLLFVKPFYHRKRIATQMVSLAVNKLYERGVREVYSAYHIGNEVSRQWHHSFGFQDIYDRFYIRIKYAWLQHEIWRCQRLNLKDKIDKLRQEKDYWYAKMENEWKD